MEDLSDLYSHPLLVSTPKMFFPGHVYHGPRALGFLRTMTGNVLVVTSHSVWREYGERLKNNLTNKDPDVVWVKREPHLAMKSDFEKHLQSKDFQYVIGFGGGSVMDVAKTASLRGAKVVLIPTTAGSGSEVSQYALFVNQQEEKEPIADSRLLPDTVLYDPSFLTSLSPRLTAETSIDAYTHVLESLTSRLSNSLSDLLALQALTLILDFAPKTRQEPENVETRSRLQLAGLLAGLAQSSASVGLIHALADFFGPRFGITHGLAVATFLLPVVKLNLARDNNYYQKIAETVSKANAYEMSRDFYNKMGLDEPSGVLAEKSIAFDDLVAFLKRDPAAKTHRFVPNAEEIKEILGDVGLEYV